MRQFGRDEEVYISDFDGFMKGNPFLSGEDGDHATK